MTDEIGEVSCMTNEKKNSMIPLLLVLIVFIVGLGLGYYIWGVKRHKQVDYKEFLKQTIDYIATIEHKNLRLVEQNTALENEMALVKEQQKQTPQDVKGSIEELEATVRTLQQDNANLRMNADRNETLIQMNEQLKKQIEILSLELESLKSTPVIPPENSQMPAKQPMQ